MEEIKNTVSDAQKAAQKKYDQKTKTVSIKYTPVDMNEFIRLKDYIDRTGQSMNGFIKGLVNNFFESGQDQKPVVNKVITPFQKRREKEEEYYPYYFVSDEGIQFFYDNFGKDVADKVLNEYEDIVTSEVEDVLEVKGNGLDDWTGEIKERINDGEFQDRSTNEVCKELLNEICDFV